MTRDVRRQITSTNVAHEVEASLSYLAKIMHQMRHAANMNSGAYSTTAANAIEIRIEKITQLFHSLDPFRSAKGILTAM